ARVVDKMPGNFMHLGFIELLFPGARIIHSMRDPLDTCLSCYFQDFSRSHPYSYDFAHLGAFYKSYEKTMQHWRKVLQIPMLEVQYEDLITNQETASRRIVDFCGLEWDDQCYNFHETQRYVATASYDQVRRPIYTSSISRWKNYSEFLAPLREALK
ncbi:MAG: sulfotransferase, partial [Thiogranum sp.]